MKSFRFGPEIADVASSVLIALKGNKSQDIKTFEGRATAGECHLNVLIIMFNLLLISLTYARKGLPLFLLHQRMARHSH